MQDAASPGSPNSPGSPGYSQSDEVDMKMTYEELSIYGYYQEFIVWDDCDDCLLYM